MEGWLGGWVGSSWKKKEGYGSGYGDWDILWIGTQLERTGWLEGFLVREQWSKKCLLKLAELSWLLGSPVL